MRFETAISCKTAHVTIQCRSTCYEYEVAVGYEVLLRAGQQMKDTATLSDEGCSTPKMQHHGTFIH